MLVEILQGISPLSTHAFVGIESLPIWMWFSSFDSTILAQQAANTDIVQNVQQAFNTFIESGQVWAFIIGLVLGYLFRTLTTYG
ncbi:MAG: hypothetical protein F6K32_21330 [Desertifilum sp. SIO1I2]|nr:hypothetical protein [Desertifilum sp. SIO1I2]